MYIFRFAARYVIFVPTARLDFKVLYVVKYTNKNGVFIGVDQ